MELRFAVSALKDFCRPYTQGSNSFGSLTQGGASLA